MLSTRSILKSAKLNFQISPYKSSKSQRQKNLVARKFGRIDATVSQDELGFIGSVSLPVNAKLY
jgi:hypothetical protein